MVGSYGFKNTFVVDILVFKTNDCDCDGGGGGGGCDCGC